MIRILKQHLTLFTNFVNIYDICKHMRHVRVMKEVKKNKKEQLIDTAKSLFINHGMRRITIDEICKTAGISRVTFYKFFQNKTELILHVLNNLMEENISLFRQIMNSDAPYQEKFRQIFDLKIHKSREYGPHFLQDILEADGALRDFISQKRIENISLSRQMLEEGQAAGEISPELNIELFLYYGELLTNTIEDKVFAALIPDIQKRAEEVTRFFMYGIMNENRPASTG